METLTVQQFLTDEQFNEFLNLDFSFELDQNGESKQLFSIQVGFNDENWIDINGTVDVYGCDVDDVNIEEFHVWINGEEMKFTDKQYNKIINKINFTF